ncbi:MAG: DUF2905 domain-containing protein [Anaerolineales bacterium]|nr:MAG: DUF2905 domain-containing protein [Anaerolineales bacterium]
MIPLARILMILGVVLLLAGGFLYLASRLQIPLGRLPGDIRIEGENFTCLFPLASMILLSVLLTILLNVIVRLLNR